VLAALLAFAATSASCKDDGGDVRATNGSDRTTSPIDRAPDATTAPNATNGAPGANGAPGDPSGGTPPTNGAPVTLPAGDDAVVDHVVDGDTLRTTDDERVRLLNIDTPEVDGHECWSGEATDFLASLIPPGTEIRLAYDVERLDRYGRTLAHVYRRADGLWINLAMVEVGAARPYVLQPNDTWYAPIEVAAFEARDAGDGLWGACDASSARNTSTTVAFGAPSNGTPNGAPPNGAPPSSASNGGDRAASCDASYPTVCIPSPPPDLDCADISARRFTVLPPDPHHFDGGGDGIGCERG
jgi:micrococcal nuclease